MSLNKLAELLQQLNKTEAIKLAELNVLTINDTRIMPDVDNTDPDDHDASEDEL